MADRESDVVELILAVDLNPSDPEEPINVNDVKVLNKDGQGDESGEGCRDCTRILDALCKIDPDLEAAVDGKPVKEAIQALEDMAKHEPEEAREEADAFEKAMSHKPEHEPRMGGRPRPFPPKREGGFRAAADRAFGKKRFEDED